MQDPADWIEVRPDPSEPAIGLDNPDLDKGERAAIGIALSEPHTLLLIDDMAGRRVAASLGIAHTGTLGVLIDSSSAGLVDLAVAVKKLEYTTFRMSASLRSKLLSQKPC
jgi:predicted nucleic acid-binding protein